MFITFVFINVVSFALVFLLVRSFPKLVGKGLIFLFLLLVLVLNLTFGELAFVFLFGGGLEFLVELWTGLLLQNSYLLFLTKALITIFLALSLTRKIKQIRQKVGLPVTESRHPLKLLSTVILCRRKNENYFKTQNG